jgi:MFS family permease
VRPRGTTVLAGTLLCCYVVLQGWALWQIALGRAGADQAFAALAIGFALVGALVASRVPRNALGWALLVIALTLGWSTFSEVYVQGPLRPGREWVAWTSAWSWYVWVVLAAVVVPLLFPTGRLLTRRWRPVGWLVAAAFALSVVGTGLRPGDLDMSVPVDNPVGLHRALPFLGVLEVVSNLLVATAFVLAAASVVVRFRRSRGVERQQLKWFALVGLTCLAAVLLAIVNVLVPVPSTRLAGTVGWFTFLGAAVVGLPVAIGIAILRHRLLDIDLVLHRTLVYGALTAALAGAYLASVLVLQVALRPVTRSSDLVVAVSTLGVAALFRPLRSRIQSWVDRRFYRRRYDATLVLTGFGRRLRDEIDVENVVADLRQVLDGTLQPSAVGVWLRGPG